MRAGYSINCPTAGGGSEEEELDLVTLVGGGGEGGGGKGDIWGFYYHQLGVFKVRTFASGDPSRGSAFDVPSLHRPNLLFLSLAKWV